MKKSIKILSLLLVFIFTLSTLFLTSCKRGTSEEVADESDSNPYIIKTEIKDGCIWVTYSNDPENPVNVGAMGIDGNTESDGSLNYLPLPDGTYGITAGKAKYLEKIVVPETYNGKPVSTILENAFNGATNLKEIVIPSTITAVGENAFTNCGKLKYNEQDGALYLGNESNPYLILVEAKDTSISKCTVNEKTVAICSDAFYNCGSLQIVNIPNSVKSIGARAFYNCSRISVINIPEGIDFIGSETFYNCLSIEKVTIPASVITISPSAFSSCKGLTNVTFAKNSLLTSIGNSAFSTCTSLKSITIPKGVLNIGDHKANKNTDGAFYNCKSLESVSFEDGSEIKQIGNFAFDACSKLASVNLPDSINKLGISAFRSCGLKKVNLPDSLTTIPQETFMGCKSLETVTFGSKTLSIGGKAFAGCSKLNNVVIPETTMYIGASAFFECSALTSLAVKDPTKWYAVGKDLIGLSSTDFGNATTAAKFVTQDYFDHSFEK